MSTHSIRPARLAYLSALLSGNAIPQAAAALAVARSLAIRPVLALPAPRVA